MTFTIAWIFFKFLNKFLNPVKFKATLASSSDFLILSVLPDKKFLKERLKISELV
jgi:hypothetical protein